MKIFSPWFFSGDLINEISRTGISEELASLLEISKLKKDLNHREFFQSCVNLQAAAVREAVRALRGPEIHNLVAIALENARVLSGLRYDASPPAYWADAHPLVAAAAFLPQVDALLTKFIDLANLENFEALRKAVGPS